MSGGISAATMLTYAVAANTIYGAVTGTPGGLIGELFAPDQKQAPAPAPAPEPRLAAPPPSAEITAQPAAAAANTMAPAATALPSVTPAAPVATTVSLANPPVVEPPKVMPTASTLLPAATKQSLVEQRRRQGRASTILTNNSTSDTLG